MQAFADRFPGWKDFPKGLRVMVVDEDPHVLLDVQRKLEACGYAASAFSGEEEALQALGNGAGEFHVAVVEATSSTTLDGFKIMAAAKHLPTIMMANTENMGIMMQGIAAGASEFLQKPLSEDKLKNIWQHVVKKALSSGCALPLPKQSSGGGGEVKAVPAPPEQRNAEPGMDPQEGGAGGVQSLLGLDQKPDVELLCYTPPQLEQSAACRVAHTEDDAADVSAPYPHRCLAASCAALDHAADVDDNFDDCEDFFHIRSDVANAVNNSSVLNELFDSKPSSLDPATHDHDHHHYHHALLLDQDHGHGIHDFHKLDPRLGDELDFDSSMHHSFEDIGLSSDLMEGDMLSLSDGGSFLHDSHQAHSFQEEASLLDCLDADDDGCDILQEIDEEALLLAEVAKAERGIAGSSSSNQSFNHQLPSTYGNTSEFSPRSSSRSDSEHSGCKGSKVANGKKKMKVDWTPELHRRFVQAVEQLGVDKAIPSRILEIMGVKCLTRHNIASHLQKFRSHRKHLRAREAEAASWNTHHRKQPRCTNPPATSSSSCVTSAWAVPRLPPPIHPRPSQLHVWGHPTTAPVDMHFWPAAWPACHVDSWAPAAGTPFYAAQPMLRLPLAPVPTSVANVVVPTPSPRPFPYGESSTKQLCNVHPPKETVDAAINEVLRNPFIPLPLGLKAPSLESVISELQRQGITMATSSS